MEQLQGAVDLYEGEFLAGFSLPDSPTFEEWVLLERGRLQRLVTGALRQLADGHIERGACDDALKQARRLVELDPLQEAAHRQVMLCLARGGQRGAALAQYERCRQILADELGVKPEAETTALYEEILSGQVAAPERVPTEPVHHLPPQLTPFVGRKAELTELERLLADPDVRLVTVVGPGGVGKTRLALEGAAGQLERYKHGVHFISLAPLRSAEAIVPALADAVGFTFYAAGEGQRVTSAKQQLLDYLRKKRMLLVMDNYEHLLDGAALVTEILRAAPGVKVLVTSRARLNLGEEQLYPLAGMDFPDWETPDDTTAYSAVALFMQSARRVRPDYEVPADDLVFLTRICRLVEGMPLGVLLAAGWVDTLSLAEIAAQMGRNLDFLETEMRDVPERQRSMRATFEHSWQLLTERRREVMQALSVFRGGFTYEAAEAVAGATLPDLRALLNRSFLEFIPRAEGQTLSRLPSDRYEIHELLRQFAAEKLDAAPGAAGAIHERHSAYYAAALERWGADIKGARQVVALAEMRADRENLRAAWDWAVQHRLVTHLDQAVEGLCRYYERRGRWQQGEVACRSATEVLSAAEELAASDQMETAASTERLRVWGKVLTWQGTFCYYLGRIETAGHLLRHGLDLLEAPEVGEADTRADRAWALHILSVVGRDSGNKEEYERLSERSLAHYRAAGDRWGTVLQTAGRAQRAMNSGAYDEARPWAEEGLALRRAIGDRWGTANALILLGAIALSRAEFEKAERLSREAVAIHREIGHRGWESFVGLIRWSRALVWRGRFADAHTVAQELATQAEDTGQTRSGIVIWARWGLGEALRHLGDYADARTQFQIGLDLAREFKVSSMNPWLLSGLGDVAMALEAYLEACGLLTESVALFPTSHDESFFLGLSLALISSAYAARGVAEAVEAREHLCQALHLAIDFNDSQPLVEALPAAALLVADGGESARSGAEQAVELYALASRYPHIANSQWYEDVVGKHLAAVAATLPPAVVAAAQERGRARDLWATATELLEELRGPGSAGPEQ